MTNNEIIMGEWLNLVCNNKITEDEQIHTYATWNYLGYAVKKGEKAIARFSIWKHVKDKKATEKGGEETTKCILVDSCFFASHQVEKKAKKEG